MRRRAWLLAALAGAVGAFGQAPYDVPLLLLAAMAVAVLLYRYAETPRAAALIGWAFGFGYFCHALQWIVSPFMVDAARHGWMAPFALVLLAAGMALFWGFAFWGARRLCVRASWPLILCWPAVELLRGYIFTGFPWAGPSQALVGVMAGQLLAVVGPYGLSLLMVAVATALAHPGDRRLRLSQGALGIGCAVALILPPLAAPAPLAERPILRLIQPNAAQRDKWDPEQIPVFFERQLKYTAAAPAQGAARPDLVI